MLRSLLLIVALAICHATHAQTETTRLDVDHAEVLRRGDSVTIVGEGPRDAAETAGLIALAPPADDSHLWHVSLFTMPNCPACTQLKSDFERSPHLRAFVAPTNAGPAWAHYNVYSSADETQRDRLKRYRLRAFPTLVIQPPRNGSWGDPRVVVMHETGYNGDAEKMAQKMADAVRRYAAKMAERGYPRPPAQPERESLGYRQPPSKSGVKADADAEQDIGTDPPFAPPPAPDPFVPAPVVMYPPPAPQPVVQIPPPPPPPPATPPPATPPKDETPPPPKEEPKPGILTHLVGLFSGILGGAGSNASTLLLLVLVCLRAGEMIAKRTKTPLDDQVVKVLLDLASAAAQARPNPDPAPSPKV